MFFFLSFIVEAVIQDYQENINQSIVYEVRSLVVYKMIWRINLFRKRV